MAPGDEFERFGFVVFGVSEKDEEYLRDNGVLVSLRAHGNAYFDYLSQRDLALQLLCRVREDDIV